MSLELFNKIYAEEKKSIPNRKELKSEVVAQVALPPTLVRYIDLVTKGKEHGNANTRTRKH